MTPAAGPYHQAAAPDHHAATKPSSEVPDMIPAPLERAAPDHQAATTVVKRIVVHGEMGTKPSAEVSDDHKKCSSCGKAKPIEGFSGRATCDSCRVHKRRKCAAKLSAHHETVTSLQLENHVLKRQLDHSELELTTSEHEVACLTELLRKHAAEVLRRHAANLAANYQNLATNMTSNNLQPPQSMFDYSNTQGGYSSEGTPGTGHSTFFGLPHGQNSLPSQSIFGDPSDNSYGGYSPGTSLGTSFGTSN